MGCAESIIHKTEDYIFDKVTRKRINCKPNRFPFCGILNLPSQQRAIVYARVFLNIKRSE